MKLTFNCNGNKKQLEAWKYLSDKEHTVVVYGGSKGSGKSFLMISFIFSMAFMYANTRYFIARKSLNDLRKFTYPDVVNIFSSWNIGKEYWKFNAQDNYFELYNGSRIYFLECGYLPSDPTYSRFGSLQFTMGAIEEAGEVDVNAYRNLSATLGRCNNDKYNLPIKLLCTCNPANNWLFTDFYKPDREGTLEPYKAFIQALPTDNKMLPSGYIENLERILSSNQRQRLLLGRWEFDDNPNLLVTYEAIIDCFTNTPSYGIKRISADIAMKGRDKCVITSWNGTEATIESATNSTNATFIENKIREIATTKQIGRSQIVVDSDGLGAYLGSYLDGIVEFHNNGKALDVKYTNLKSQCGFKLAELINNRQLRINCPEELKNNLKEELMVLIQKDTDSKLSLISKDEMKQLIGHSPDYLDSLLMGMYGLIKPTTSGLISSKKWRNRMY